MIEPTGHFVLVKPDNVLEEDEAFKGANELGIYLPEDVVGAEQAATRKGTVVAIGPQAWKAFGKNYDGENWAEVGDKVFFPRYNNQSLADPDTGEIYFLLSDDKIFAKYKESE